MTYNPNRKPPGSAGGTGGQFDYGATGAASASGANLSANQPSISRIADVLDAYDRGVEPDSIDYPTDTGYFSAFIANFGEVSLHRTYADEGVAIRVEDGGYFYSETIDDYGHARTVGYTDEDIVLTRREYLSSPTYRSTRKGHSGLRPEYEVDYRNGAIAYTAHRSEGDIIAWPLGDGSFYVREFFGQGDPYQEYTATQGDLDDRFDEGFPGHTNWVLKDDYDAFAADADDLLKRRRAAESEL